MSRLTNDWEGCAGFALFIIVASVLIYAEVRDLRIHQPNIVTHEPKTTKVLPVYVPRAQTILYMTSETIEVRL